MNLSNIGGNNPAGNRHVVLANSHNEATLGEGEDAPRLILNDEFFDRSAVICDLAYLGAKRGGEYGAAVSVSGKELAEYETRHEKLSAEPKFEVIDAAGKRQSVESLALEPNPGGTGHYRQNLFVTLATEGGPGSVIQGHNGTLTWEDSGSGSAQPPV